MESKPTVGIDLARRTVAEGLGTGFLLAIVVGSGIMAEGLAEGNVALVLLANSIAKGAGLAALILAFGEISGAHFNPVVTIAAAWRSELAWRAVPPYIAAQSIGAFVGVAGANLMFAKPALFASHHVRQGAGQMLGEVVASFGLLMVIFGCSRFRPLAVPIAVGSYIAAAYWFTSSTSFANPAVTLARSASDTFAGIRLADTLGFIAAQLSGAMAAAVLFRWMDTSPTKDPG